MRVEGRIDKNLAGVYKMPGKSRRGKGRYLTQSKKGRGRSRRMTVPAQQPPAAQNPEPVSSPKVSVPSASVPTPIAKLASVGYPYVVAELRSIAILAGAMLIVLVVLALTLS